MNTNTNTNTTTNGTKSAAERLATILLVLSPALNADTADDLALFHDGEGSAWIGGNGRVAHLDVGRELAQLTITENDRVVRDLVGRDHEIARELLRMAGERERRSRSPYRRSRVG